MKPIHFIFGLLVFTSLSAQARLIFPGTDFCGPGRRFGYEAEARNVVDQACKEHDLCVRGSKEIRKESRFQRGQARRELKTEYHVDRCSCDNTFIEKLQSLRAEQSRDPRMQQMATTIQGLAETFFSSCRKAARAGAFN